MVSVVYSPNPSLTSLPQYSTIFLDYEPPLVTNPPSQIVSPNAECTVLTGKSTRTLGISLFPQVEIDAYHLHELKPKSYVGFVSSNGP